MLIHNDPFHFCLLCQLIDAPAKSIHNQHVKDWKKLQTKKARRQTGTYLLDGWHLVQEASKAGIELLEVVGTAEQLAAHPELEGMANATYEVTEEIMKHITDTVDLLE